MMMLSSYCCSYLITKRAINFHLQNCEDGRWKHLCHETIVYCRVGGVFCYVGWWVIVGFRLERSTSKKRTSNKGHNGIFSLSKASSLKKITTPIGQPAQFISFSMFLAAGSFRPFSGPEDVVVPKN